MAGNFGPEVPTIESWETSNENERTKSQLTSRGERVKGFTFSPPLEIDTGQSDNSDLRPAPSSSRENQQRTASQGQRRDER